MSTPAAQAPSPIFQIAGTYLPLPPSSRIDLAFITTIDAAQPQAGHGYSYDATSNYIDFVTSLFFQFKTSSAAGSRTVGVSFVDENGDNVAQVIAPASQPTAATYNYTFNVGLPFQTGPVGDAITSGLPLVPLFSGYSLEVAVVGIDVADQLEVIGLLLTRIPTGPQLNLVPVPVLASPVLV